MSYSTLYILNQKSTTEVAEFRNGYGSGPCIWDHLAERYLSHVNFKDYNRMDYVGIERKWNMVWELAAEGTAITREERIAMMITFDKAYIPLPFLNHAGEACQLAYEQIVEFGYWKGVNHWKDIGTALCDMSQDAFHHAARGVVLNCTSVADMWSQPSADYLENAWSIYGDETKKEEA